MVFLRTFCISSGFTKVVGIFWKKYRVSKGNEEEFELEIEIGIVSHVTEPIMARRCKRAVLALIMYIK